MNKISIVIPTMWRSSNISLLLDRLQNCSRVGEIIVIDNDYNLKNIDLNPYDKVRYIKMESNIYVNPSWNLGVEESKYDNVMLLNDDILFNTNFIDIISIESDTIIGLSEESYHNPGDNNFRLEEANCRNWGFGCMIIFNKESYPKIPDELKIWCGDDYIFNRFPKKMNIKGVYIETNMSTTSDMKVFDSVKSNDEVLYKKYI